jgi:hypothetical protein
MGPECVKQPSLSQVPETHQSFFASAKEKLMLGGVSKAGSTSIVAIESSDTGFPLREQCVPECNIPAVSRVARCGQQRRAPTLENKVGRVLSMSLHCEEGHCSGSSLPKRRVAIAITDTKLIALLCEHNSVDLGEHPSRPDSGDLGGMGPFPD